MYFSYLNGNKYKPKIELEINNFQHQWKICLLISEMN